MPNIQLTVLLATRNGEHVLPRTLEGYCRAASPPVSWKIVVIDNGSTDATPAIIKSFGEKLPLEMLYQPLAGKSRALNSGIAAVEGRLVVFTDDDTIPSPSFLEAWAQYLESRTDYGLFGGSIEPMFEVPAPRWLVKSRLRFAQMFGERSLPEGPISPDEIFGGNMAVRASVFEQGIRFDDTLGAASLDPTYAMGEDTDICRRIVQAGNGCWFAKRPLVHHIIRARQLTEAAWKRRAYQNGRARARLMLKGGHIETPPAPSLIERLALYSPLARHRYNSLSVYHLSQGFRDEFFQKCR